MASAPAASRRPPGGGGGAAAAAAAAGAPYHRRCVGASAAPPAERAPQPQWQGAWSAGSDASPASNVVLLRLNRPTRHANDGAAAQPAPQPPATTRAEPPAPLAQPKRTHRRADAAQPPQPADGHSPPHGLPALQPAHQHHHPQQQQHVVPSQGTPQAAAGGGGRGGAAAPAPQLRLGRAGPRDPHSAGAWRRAAGEGGLGAFVSQGQRWRALTRAIMQQTDWQSLDAVLGQAEAEAGQRQHRRAGWQARLPGGEGPEQQRRRRQQPWREEGGAEEEAPMALNGIHVSAAWRRLAQMHAAAAQQVRPWC